MARLSFWHCPLQGRARESLPAACRCGGSRANRNLACRRTQKRHRLNWRGCLPQGQRGSPENIFCFSAKPDIIVINRWSLRRHSQKKRPSRRSATSDKQPTKPARKIRMIQLWRTMTKSDIRAGKTENAGAGQLTARTGPGLKLLCPTLTAHLPTLPPPPTVVAFAPSPNQNRAPTAGNRTGATFWATT